MITAVNGVVMSSDDARILLDELERHADMAPNARIVAIQLRKILKPKAADQARFSQARTTSIATQNTTLDPSSSAHETGPDHDVQRERLTTADAATLLGITPNAVRELRRRGVIRGHRTGGRWKFDASEIDARAAATRKE